MNEVELHTARAEAVMAQATAAMNLLLDGPNSRNRHFAIAVRTTLNDLLPKLAQHMQNLTEAALDTGTMSQGAEDGTNAERAQALEDLTDRYDKHMNAHFRNDEEFTAQSVSFILAIHPITVNAAVRNLHSETIAREPQDPIRLAYEQAIRETAEEIPDQRIALEKLGNDPHAQNPRAKAARDEALRALDDNERIIGAMPRPESS